MTNETIAVSAQSGIKQSQLRHMAIVFGRSENIVLEAFRGLPHEAQVALKQAVREHKRDGNNLALERALQILKGRVPLVELRRA